MIQVHLPLDNLNLDKRSAYLQSIKTHQKVTGVLLATCDRVEVYDGCGAVEEKTLRHLFRVASGLNSPYLGENSILGQVKTAYLEACSERPLDTGLHRLFQGALKTGKRVRTETKISQGAMGHAQGVMNILQDQKIDLTRSGVLLLGVNKLTSDLLCWLEKKGAHTIVLGNRTIERAREIAQGTKAEVSALSELMSLWPQVDLVISMTSAPHLIVQEDQVPRDKDRWFFDLAAPRDLDPRLRGRSEIHFFDLEDLERLTSKTLSSRLLEAEKAEKIVDEEVQLFLADQKKREQMKLLGHRP